MTRQCSICKHYVGVGVCKAYPISIPTPILLGEHDHVYPYPGDNGIQFEPIDTSDVPEQPDNVRF